MKTFPGFFPYTSVLNCLIPVHIPNKILNFSSYFNFCFLRFLFFLQGVHFLIYSSTIIFQSSNVSCTGPFCSDCLNYILKFSLVSDLLFCFVVFSENCQNNSFMCSLYCSQYKNCFFL